MTNALNPSGKIRFQLGNTNDDDLDLDETDNLLLITCPCLRLSSDNLMIFPVEEDIDIVLTKD